MKLVLSVCLLFLPYQTTTSHTVKEPVILVYGDELSMYFLITLLEEDTIAIRTIPTDTLLPISCAFHQVSAIGNIQDRTCLTHSLEAAFPIRITNVVTLHTKQIEADFTFSNNAAQIENFTDFQSYFHELGTQVSLSTIWKFSSYISTDLSLKDLMHFYHIYTSDDFQIQYYFLHLISINKVQKVAIDRKFYECLTCNT